MFSSIPRGPLCPNGRLLCPLPRFVVSPQRLSLSEGRWVLQPLSFLQSRQRRDRKRYKSPIGPKKSQRAKKKPATDRLRVG
jgi:hypothetical protein